MLDFLIARTKYQESIPQRHSRLGPVVRVGATLFWVGQTFVLMGSRQNHVNLRPFLFMTSQVKLFRGEGGSALLHDLFPSSALPL